MTRSLSVLLVALLAGANSAMAQQPPYPYMPPYEGPPSYAAPPSSPVPLSPYAAPPRSIEPEQLPPLSAPLPRAPETRPAAAPQRDIAPLSPPPAQAAVGATSGMAGEGSGGSRDLCEQTVPYSLAPGNAVPERFRPFLGIWSDASWTPQLCAALIVQNVQPDGTAAILYVFGPTGSRARVPGGVLRGTGVIRNGELRFQNSDGSQFAFRRLYGDLAGTLTTPQGQNYQAVFKKAL